MTNRVLAHTGAKYPIIQAPMAGATTPAMAAAAANAGAMGSLGCAMMGIEAMTAELRAAQALRGLCGLLARSRCSPR